MMLLQELYIMATSKECAPSAIEKINTWLYMVYFFIFRAKMIDLAAEISKLQKEVDSFNQENATFLTYEKR